MKKKDKIIWAVDAFMEDKELHTKCAATLKNWTRTTPVDIEPVFVMSPDQLSIPAAALPAIRKEIKKSAQGRLDELLKMTPELKVSAPTFLVSPNFSLKKAVETLLEHARTSGATLIAVSTHSKSGLARLLLGSFAETLIMQSDIPVILVNPKTNKPHPFKRILYSTDLTEKSEHIFQEVLDMARTHKLHLVLYNKLEYMSEYTVPTITSVEMYQKVIKEDVENRKKKMEQLVKRAKAQGVKAEAIVDNKTKGLLIHEAILKHAEKDKADLIAVASHAGLLATNLLGSVARQIIRNSTRPVWVIHPLSGSAVQKKSSRTSKRKAASL